MIFKVIPIIIQNITPQPPSSAGIVEANNREYRLVKMLRKNMEENLIETEVEDADGASVES